MLPILASNKFPRWSLSGLMNAEWVIAKQPNPPSPSLGQYKLVKSTSTNQKKYIYVKLKQKKFKL